MSSRRKPHIFVFAKAPALGRGKSRLADGLGRVEALRINRMLHAKAIHASGDSRFVRVLTVTPDHAVRLKGLLCWGKTGVRAAQGRGDLGRRLAKCVADFSRQAPRAPVVIVGTDCPSLTRVHIARACERARRDGVYIIPATDGGFVLIAARRAQLLEHAFSPVFWSSARTLGDVCANLVAAGQRFSLAAALADIDTPADWRAATRAPASCGL